jgi:PKHD-type hydroxylase
MIVCIGDFLDDAAIERLLKLIDSGTFVDGRATAGWGASLVKNNLQLVALGKAYDEALELIVDKLRENVTFQMAAMPRVLRPPLISRSNTGMGYGAHVDDAIMGTPPIRADISYTLFLSGPDEYAGGELVLEDTQGEHSYKLARGAMVLYPATFLHRVEKVRAGSRLVAVGWVQSLCRLAPQREILFDLQRLQRTEFERSGKSAQFDLLAKVFSNLLRLLADA